MSARPSVPPDARPGRAPPPAATRQQRLARHNAFRGGLRRQHHERMVRQPFAERRRGPLVAEPVRRTGQERRRGLQGMAAAGFKQPLGALPCPEPENAARTRRARRNLDHHRMLGGRPVRSAMRHRPAAHERIPSGIVPGGCRDLTDASTPITLNPASPGPPERGWTCSHGSGRVVLEPPGNFGWSSAYMRTTRRSWPTASAKRHHRGPDVHRPASGSSASGGTAASSSASASAWTALKRNRRDDLARLGFTRCSRSSLPPRIRRSRTTRRTSKSSSNCTGASSVGSPPGQISEPVAHPDRQAVPIRRGA